jgi:hypothetical protein
VPLCGLVYTWCGHANVSNDCILSLIKLKQPQVFLPPTKPFTWSLLSNLSRHLENWNFFSFMRRVLYFRDSEGLHRVRGKRLLAAIIFFLTYCLELLCSPLRSFGACTEFLQHAKFIRIACQTIRCPSPNLSIARVLLFHPPLFDITKYLNLLPVINAHRYFSEDQDKS